MISANLSADSSPVVFEFSSMASTVQLRFGSPVPGLQSLVGSVVELFGDIERSCTRFDPTSPLMRANARCTEWTLVPSICRDVIGEAFQAYRATDGLFDPRVLQVLCRLGYDRTFSELHAAGAEPVASGAVRSDPADSGQLDEPWQPDFAECPAAVRLGRHPIDLGGIGKGLALRWAVQRLRRGGDDFVLDAGGDCYLAGRQPDGRPWPVGVEDPVTATRPAAVLELSDLGVATTSTRIRRWQADGQQVHHIIDPRTGRPAAGGLRSVTTLDPDPARAEVLSKVLFLHGRRGVAAAAERFGVPALWIDDEGALDCTSTVLPYLVWRAA